MPPIPFRENDLIYKNSPDLVPGYAFDEKDAIWIPTEPGIENRFLMFDLNRNSFAVVVRCQPGSLIARHYHMGPVLGYSLQGKWKYHEYDWIAAPGTCIYEPPGEAHTLQILGDEVMMSMFHVMGPHIQLDENDRQVGYVEAFNLLEYSRNYCAEHGMDASYFDKIIRR
jgi:quercetin dioxygenase-like cupin family protein